ncbi:MAG: type II toxin-antitoxin system Phd/YefM family antitoxin [Caulobacter sp.]|jgi:prevent-host-death family protein
MARYSVADAKNNLPRLLDLVLQGEEVVITRRGEPIVRLSPERQVSAPQDADWIRQRRVTPASPVDFDPVEAIRALRDDARY